MERQYIGVDLHKQFFQACAMTASGTRMWERRFPRTEGGVTLFRACCDGEAAIAVEASGPTWVFVDAITAGVGAVCVVDMRKTRLKAGFAAKTDRLDARRLADALRRDSVVSVYVPPPAIRELREVCRGRHQLVRLRSRVAMMIRSLLLRSGAADVPVRRVFSARGLAWLETVTLPAEAGVNLSRWRQVLAAVQTEAAAAEAIVLARAASDPIACALATIAGIGPILGLTLHAEIGDITRFDRGAHLASYAGLVPRVDASGDRYWSGRITRQGSPWLRWALVEAAMNGMRRTDAVGRWVRHLAIRKGALKARVALARRLCDDIVTVWPRSTATECH